MLLLAKVSWADETVPFDQPGCVVCLTEFEQRLSQLLDGFEDPHPHQVLLERSDEPFGASELVTWYLCEALRMSGHHRLSPALRDAICLKDWLDARRKTE